MDSHSGLIDDDERTMSGEDDDECNSMRTFQNYFNFVRNRKWSADKKHSREMEKR